MSFDFCKGSVKRKWKVDLNKLSLTGLLGCQLMSCFVRILALAEAENFIHKLCVEGKASN